MSLSVKEFARSLEVSVQAVHKAIKEGRLVEGVQEIDGKILINPDIAIEEWQLSLQRPSRSKLSTSSEFEDGEGSNLSKNVKKSIAVQQLFKAKLTQLEYEKRSKKLIGADQVSKDFGNLAKTLRDGLLAIPDRISSEIAGLSDASAIHARLTSEIRTCLQDMVNTYRNSKTLPQHQES